MPATKTPGMHHPRRRNVTTTMVGFFFFFFNPVTYAKISQELVNLRDVDGKAEEEFLGRFTFRKNAKCCRDYLRRID